MVAGLVVAVGVAVVQLGDDGVDHSEGRLGHLRCRLGTGAFDSARVERDEPVRGRLAEDSAQEPVRLGCLARGVPGGNVGVPGADKGRLDLGQLALAEGREDDPVEQTRYEFERPGR